MVATTHALAINKEAYLVEAYGYKHVCSLGNPMVTSNGIVSAFSAEDDQLIVCLDAQDGINIDSQYSRDDVLATGEGEYGAGVFALIARHAHTPVAELRRQPAQY